MVSPRFLNKNNAGFTILEVIIAIVILGLLAAIPIADFILLQKKTDLDNSIQEFVGTLRLAQNKTLASDSNSRYGVYLDTSVFPNQYTLFKGESYAYPERDTSSDQVYFLSNKIEFYDINLGSGSEVVFYRLSGVAEQSGNISFRVKVDPVQSRTVYISNSGAFSFSEEPIPSDENRVKDTRHLVFDYNRPLIDIGSEYITLTFDIEGGNYEQQIPISQYLISDQLEWSGEVATGETTETIYTHTYRLNEPEVPNTQFSVHRDGSLNSKSLKITISGDSGYLARYSLDGLSADSESLYVSNFELQ